MDESKPGVAEIKVSETGKLVGLLEDLSRRLKKTRDSDIHHGRREEEEYRPCPDK